MGFGFGKLVSVGGIEPPLTIFVPTPVLAVSDLSVLPLNYALV